MYFSVVAGKLRQPVSSLLSYCTPFLLDLTEQCEEYHLKGTHYEASPYVIFSISIFASYMLLGSLK